MPNKDRIMTRNINSIVGHFVAECNLDQKTTIIRDPRNAYKPVAFVPSVEKAEVLQAIRRVGQKTKLEQSLELLGIQAISDVSEIDLTKAAKFASKAIGDGKESTRVSRPLRPGGSLPEVTAKDAYTPPPAVPARVRKAAPPEEKKAPVKSKDKVIVKKAATAKKAGSEHGW